MSLFSIKSTVKHYLLTILSFGFCFSLLHVNTVSAENSLEYELDPYYTNAGYYISLSEDPIPEVISEKESNIYQDMLGSVKSPPRFFLIEASINPLPIAGVYLKKNHNDFYSKGEIRDDLNIIQALTEGFEEPYAVSLFLGSVVQFIKPGESEVSSNKGYAGYLLSFGDKHIVSNTQVNDNWYELEFKIKGDQAFKSKTLSWSLRSGVKMHSNKNITDVIHFGVRRNHLDSELKSINFIDNSDVEYKVEFNKETLQLVEQELFINKKWHLGFSEKSVFSFGIGFVIEGGKYTGSLAKATTDFRVIFRPNLNF